MDVVNESFVFAERRPDGSVHVTKGAKNKQFLDPEIANEGEYGGNKIILSDGEQVSWTPPTVKPVMPDWSEIKSLAKYFNKTGYQTWPCWYYHPTQEPIIIKNAEEAFERFGIKRRKASDRERAMFGTGEWVWDAPEDCQWQPAPYKGNTPGKFDPQKGEQGKNFVPHAPDPQIAQHALIKELVAAMQGGQNEFLMQLVTAMQSAAAAPAALHPHGEGGASRGGVLADPGSAAGVADEEKAAWIAKAKEAGVKIDGRWSLEKIREHVLGELEKRVAEAEAAPAAAELGYES